MREGEPLGGERLETSSESMTMACVVDHAVPTLEEQTVHVRSPNMLDACQLSALGGISTGNFLVYIQTLAEKLSGRSCACSTKLPNLLDLSVKDWPR